ncbi:hypothetical protein Tco_0744156 [Tanacetum coccineum]
MRSGRSRSSLDVLDDPLAAAAEEKKKKHMVPSFLTMEWSKLLDQQWLRVIPISLTRAISHWLRNGTNWFDQLGEDLKTKFFEQNIATVVKTAKKMEEIQQLSAKSQWTLIKHGKRF